MAVLSLLELNNIQGMPIFCAHNPFPKDSYSTLSGFVIMLHSDDDCSFGMPFYKIPQPPK